VNATIAATTTTPPITPPTIAPIGVELDEDVGVAEDYLLNWGGRGGRTVVDAEVEVDVVGVGVGVGVTTAS